MENSNMKTSLKDQAQSVIQAIAGRTQLFEEALDSISQQSEDADDVIVQHLSSYSEIIVSKQNTASEQCKNIRSNQMKRFSIQETSALVYIRHMKILSRNRKSLASVCGIPMGHLPHVTRSLASYLSVLHSGGEYIGNVFFSLPQNFSINKGTEYDSCIFVSTGFYSINRQVHDIQKPLATTGKSGNGDLQFSFLWGIAVDPVLGHIYVVDNANNRIQVVDSSHKLVKIIDASDSPAGRFHCPVGLSFSPDGQTFVVTEYSGNRIRIFDRAGKWLKTGDGTGGNATLALNNPWYVTHDHSGNIYVSDQNNYRIVKFTYFGEYIREIGGQSSPVPIGKAMGIAVNDWNELLVIAEAGNLVRVYSTEGHHIRDHNVTRTQDRNFLARGPNGGFCLSGQENNFIEFYNYKGELIHKLQVDTPNGVVFDISGRMFVSNWSRNYFTQW